MPDPLPRTCNMQAGFVQRLTSPTCPSSGKPLHRMRLACVFLLLLSFSSWSSFVNRSFGDAPKILAHVQIPPDVLPRALVSADERATWPITYTLNRGSNIRCTSPIFSGQSPAANVDSGVMAIRP